MAIKAIFVGVNKHLDTSIPELNGARRDATALWALFTDAVEGLGARLLVDETATHTEVSEAMLGGLATARADDVLVIACEARFSGWQLGIPWVSDVATSWRTGGMSSRWTAIDRFDRGIASPNGSCYLSHGP